MKIMKMSQSKLSIFGFLAVAMLLALACVKLPAAGPYNGDTVSTRHETTTTETNSVIVTQNCSGGVNNCTQNVSAGVNRSEVEKIARQESTDSGFNGFLMGFLFLGVLLVVFGGLAWMLLANNNYDNSKQWK